MPKDYSFEKRKYIIGGVAVAIIALYIVRIFTLQLLSDDYRQRADSNAFRKEVLFPARGQISDRNGFLMVYNEPSYNITVVMQDQHGIDTLDFCQTVGITREEYIARMADIKDSEKHPNYSRNTPQLFMSQIPATEFSKIREKLFRFNGFAAEKRTVRCYAGPWKARWRRWLPAFLCSLRSCNSCRSQCLPDSPRPHRPERGLPTGRHSSGRCASRQRNH